MATLKVEVSAHDFILGSANAPVTLVEYGDYECPHCARAQPVVEAVRDAMGDDLRVVFRAFPLAEMHPHAMHAAEAAQATGAQGKFWEMHFALFDHQKRGLTDADLVAVAQSVGVDGDVVTQALADGTFVETVRAAKSGGIRSGVNGTPTFFINGTRHDDSFDEETLLAACEAAKG